MSTLLKPKHQRLVLVVIALVAILAAGMLAAWGLHNQASYFYVPSELLAAHPSPGQAGRLGGMVEKGSLKTAPDGVTIDFADSSTSGGLVFHDPKNTGSCKSSSAPIVEHMH